MNTFQSVDRCHFTLQFTLSLTHFLCDETTFRVWDIQHKPYRGPRSIHSSESQNYWHSWINLFWNRSIERLIQTLLIWFIPHLARGLRKLASHNCFYWPLAYVYYFIIKKAKQMFYLYTYFFKQIFIVVFSLLS